MKAVLALALVMTFQQAFAKTWRVERPQDHVELLKTDRMDKDDAAFFALKNKVAKAFCSGDIASLQAMVNIAAKPEVAMANGLPALSVFYDGIEICGDDLKSGNKQGWKRLNVIADRWASAHLDSPYPLLAKTKLLMQYAWKVRGNGYSDAVSDEAMAEFESDMRELKRRLEDSKATAGVAPEWYYQMAQTYVYLSEGDERIYSLVDEALRKFPAYYPIYTAASSGFLPKWGGSDQQFIKFVNHVRETAPSGYGPMLYAQIYYAASCCDYFDGTVFTQGGAEWPKLKEGLEDLRRRYPDVFNQDMTAYFSCAAMDKTLVPSLMAEIGNSPDAHIWKLTQYFRGCQKMAELMRRHPDGPLSAWYPTEN